VSGEKTEQPTEKKLRDARKKGQVPKSRELGTAAVVLAAAGALSFTGASMLASLRASFALVLRAIDGTLVAPPGAVLEVVMGMGLRAVAPVLCAALVAGTLASFLQVGPMLALDAVSPQLSRVDPVQGAKNLLSKKQLLELLKSVLKLVVIGWVAYATLRDGIRGTLALTGADAEATLSGAGALVSTVLFRAGGALAVLAVLDVLYQRWQFREEQKMSKDEVKREHKESDGDPHTKGERERLRRELLEHGVLERVRTADVLVVNPTHLAIALKYDEAAEQEAPELLAKGMDELAQRMIRAAEEAGVPVLRDVPLAHALFGLDEGDEIPEALYEAVAAVLHAAWKEREASEGRGEGEPPR
jgi:type III secretion YscU/HrpY family protein